MTNTQSGPVLIERLIARIETNGAAEGFYRRYVDNLAGRTIDFIGMLPDVCEALLRNGK